MLRAVVPVFEDPLVARAGQDQGGVVAAETLAQAQDAGEDLLGRDQGIVDEVHVAQADVAGAAVVLLERLAEVLQDRPVPADGAGAVAVHPVELGQGDLLGLLPASGSSCDQMLFQTP